MKVGEFCNALGDSQNSYRRFMGQSGDKGFESDCYASAIEFFLQREADGIPMPKKQKAAASGTGRSKAQPGPDISDVHLEGEDTDSVPVYDSCGEIRKKISTWLRRPEVTQAQFLRDLAAQYRTETRKVSTNQLTAFRGKSGPDAGNTSCVYYSSYVFFEKLRIKEGKPQSKHRQDMEAAWRGGMDTKRRRDSGIWAVDTDIVEKDKLGRWAINGRTING